MTLDSGRISYSCGYFNKPIGLCVTRCLFFLVQGNEKTNETQIFFQTRLNDVAKRWRTSRDFFIESLRLNGQNTLISQCVQTCFEPYTTSRRK